MKLPIYQVDAFSGRLFAGNPAAIVPLINWLPDTTMQRIALENNLSETAFFVKTGNDFHIRWFSPTAEIDLCGHATLATGFVIMKLISPELDVVRFDSQSGPLSVERVGERFQLDFPSRPGKAIPSPPQLEAALGLEPQATLLSRDCLVVVGSEQEVRALTPDMDRLLEIDGDGVLVTAPGSDCDFISRCFFPKLGITEDPVTGSAHCTLVPYWSDRLGKTALHSRQASARGGELWCELVGSRVLIAGECVLYLTGEIETGGEGRDSRETCGSRPLNG
ncbi:MAG: PhzF family phenazine biosynthesis protein [Candidatus Delongbacteria bacterium]|nr:PhzF family phenazine biosynthesis protein [Candidatus Delongbacteria bacterium]